MATRSVRIQVLGSLRVWREGAEVELGPPGRRAVLGLLTLAGGDAVARRDLVDALWGDRPPPSAVNVVQTHVKHLRRLLEPGRAPRAGSGVLPHVGGGYAVRRDAVDVDLWRFRELLAEANDAHRDDDAGRVVASLGEALRLWHGRPLADLPPLTGHPKVVSLVAERREAFSRYAGVMIDVGAAAEVLPGLAEAAAEQPLDEAAQALLIRAHHALGQRGEAFRLYGQVRSRLVDELGIDPGPELLAAHAAVLRDPGARRTPAAAPAETRPVHRIPKQLPAEPRGFTGRAAELALLDGLAGGGIAAISGTAGVGKTALAVYWAHRVRNRFPDGQLYANLRGHAPGSPATPVEILAQFLSALGIPPERVPPDVETAAALYRTLTTDRRILVLLDNAVDPDQVRPLLPAGPGCLVVVTARDRLTGLVAVHGARRLTLDVLSPDDAVALLADVLGHGRVHAEPEAALEFAKLCVHLPLALRIAAANLADRPGSGIDDYVAELREGNLLAALAVPGDEQTAVRTAFDLSHAALPADAQRLFRLLSLVPGADVGADAVAALAGTEPPRAVALLDRLAAAHLVDHHLPGRYRFHDLLRRYAAEQADRLEPAAERERALRRLYDWYLASVDGAARLLYPHMLRLPVSGVPAAFPGLGEASAWLDTERGNLVAAVRFAAGRGPRAMAWRLADALRGYFWMCMRGVEWLAAAEAGLSAAEADGGPRARAATRLSLADLHFRQGRYRQAVRQYTASLLLAREAGWAEAQAAVLGNLGCVYWQSGRLAAAASRFGRGLALSRRIGQPAGEAVAFGNLGLVHWEMGKLAEAAEHYTQALRRYRRIGSRYGEAINLANLGQTQRARGRTAEAVELLCRSLDLQCEAGNRGGEAETRSRLALAHSDRGHRAVALECAGTGLALAREAGDPRTEAEALAAYAAVLARFGDRPGAIRRYGQALDLIRETGDRYPEVDALIGLAAVTADPEPAREALVLAEQAGYRALRGLALTALAGALLARGDRGAAVECAREALALHQETGHGLGEGRTVALLDRLTP
ncbi:DNA-binding transcriptional activator of the SARP family [Amycolatopsis tolypomycina]|uniref:DNA-binding transcriptional activator of the SARP family n=1 Tax=Amycolatopsis tolypomycina TaxID=208445 RepID=A0A1H4TFA2_9PSEU|nr:AfsR/SARP family transcriptional regulator [Amycolatopsis tolypomycina]SEC54930.1 DNA-binding transcriptional activator of the SARP family [Amycolatopsis tolypomycina]